MTESDQQENVAEAAEDETGGYPSLEWVFEAILQNEELPKTGVKRVEVNAFASKDATCLVSRWDEDEPVGAYLEAEQG